MFQNLDALEARLFHFVFLATELQRPKGTGRANFKRAS
jgi:hypothetical protein